VANCIRCGKGIYDPGAPPGAEYCLECLEKDVEEAGKRLSSAYRDCHEVHSQYMERINAAAKSSQKCLDSAGKGR
jgi:hypothetical protein